MIKLDNVSKRLGDFHLRNINLTIYDNEYFIILGPTGTGKTVILETIAGMYKPDKGDIYFNDKKINNMYPEERNIGFVYQDYMLFPHLNVKENIVFGLKIKKLPVKLIEEKLEKMVNLLGIRHLLHRFPDTLSGGEQQRVAIARALITSPEVLLLDEPLSALDPRTKEKFQQELKIIHEKLKTTTIHITHDFTEALSLADRIGVMHKGQIIQIGTPQEVFSKPKSKFVATFVGMENIFEGFVKTLNGKKGVLIEDIFIPKENELEGKVNIGIRPEKITLTKTLSQETDDKHYIKGKIKTLIPKGALIKVKLEAKLPIVALIPNSIFHEMELNMDSPVYAVIKNKDIHIF